MQKSLLKISDGLKDGDVASADKAQLSLGVDWPDLCGTWHVGIRHLVADAKSRSNPEAEEGDGGKSDSNVISSPLQPIEK